VPTGVIHCVDGGHGASAPLPTLQGYKALRDVACRGMHMANESSLSLPELNDRIAILQDNIRQLIEQAAAASGELNQERIADRINQQNDELERLMKERDARLNTKPTGR
jgi:uncharacterized small protein (DUF1192 family)